MSISEEQIHAGLLGLAGRGQELSAKKEATRRRILTSATELLLERGFRRMNMEEIAERAGVARGTLYTYARSKEDIVVQALAEEQLEHRRPLLGLELPARDRLERIIADSIACFERMPLLAMLVRGDADLLRSLERRPDVLEAFAGVDDQQLLVAAIEAVLEDAKPGQAAAAAAALRALAAVGPQLVDAAPAYGLTPTQLAEQLAGMLVDGIGGA